MEKEKCHESEPANAVAETLERLAKEADRERQSVGYPDRCGKIRYSDTVRHLVAEALGYGFSLNIVARASGVSTQSLHKWCEVKPPSLFRELRIVPSQGPEQSATSPLEKQESLEEPTRSVEFILPSGVRVIVNRQDLDANLLGLFIGTKGA